MLEAFLVNSPLHPYKKFYGFKVKKIYVPFILMAVISIAMPQASFIGHLAGITAALLISKCYLHYILIPR